MDWPEMTEGVRLCRLQGPLASMCVCQPEREMWHRAKWAFACRSRNELKRHHLYLSCQTRGHTDHGTNTEKILQTTPTIPLPSEKYYPSVILTAHHCYRAEWTVQGLCSCFCCWKCSPPSAAWMIMTDHLSVCETWPCSQLLWGQRNDST